MNRAALALALLVAAAGGARAADNALLPPGGVPQGWARTGAAAVFQPSGLFNHIDGGAELFLEFGFEELTVQRYARAGGEIALEVYRMADQPAALGVYLMKCGRERRDPSFAPRHTIGQYQLQFRKNRYFVIATSTTGTTEHRSVLLALARFVADRLPPDGRVPELDLLPRRGLIPGSVRLARGPYALQPIVTLGEGNLLGLGGRATAAIGEYRRAGGTGTDTLVVVEYAGTEAAHAALTAVRKNRDPEWTVANAAPDQLTLADRDGRHAALTVEGARLTMTVE